MWFADCHMTGVSVQQPQIASGSAISNDPHSITSFNSVSAASREFTDHVPRASGETNPGAKP